MYRVRQLEEIEKRSKFPIHSMLNGFFGFNQKITQCMSQKGKLLFDHTIGCQQHHSIFGKSPKNIPHSLHFTCIHTQKNDCVLQKHLWIPCHFNTRTHTQAPVHTYGKLEKADINLNQRFLEIYVFITERYGYLC